jgi:hypothetical protein
MCNWCNPLTDISGSRPYDNKQKLDLQIWIKAEGTFYIVPEEIR